MIPSATIPLNRNDAVELSEAAVRGCEALVAEVEGNASSPGAAREPKGAPGFSRGEGVAPSFGAGASSPRLAATAWFRLNFALDGCQIRLRELTGHDERRVAGTSTEDAIQLLDAVMIPVPGGGTSLRAEDLVTADRDRVLAALYVQTFSDRIENTLRCEACRSPFDIHFSMRELAATLDRRPQNPQFTPVGPNVFESAGGWRFRLPTGRDERAAAAAPRHTAESVLAERCVTGTDTRPDLAILQTALDEVAPLLEFELKAACPECTRVHLVQFDIQTYLLRSLLNEQVHLFVDVHRLAVAYGWSANEILSLTRTERCRLVELVENEASRRRTS